MRRTQSFPYAPLAPTCIRLFRVNRDISSPDDGFLEEFPLEEAPPFYALSHTWGTGSLTVAIQVNGEVLLATQDLASGIRRFRELAVDGCGLDPPIEYMWIDSLCIDQEDNRERSSQVALMRSIYSRSIRTLIWLGLEETFNSVAWDLVDQIYYLFKSRHPDATRLSDIPVQAYSDSSHTASGLPTWNHPLWGRLRQLMEYQWFSRIWVIQEVALSTEDPVIIHHQRLYPWHRLEWAVAWMRRNGYMRLAQIPENLQNVNTMFNLRQSEVKWPLDALMSITQIKFHASDQRDKVYGLLGLAAECQTSCRVPEPLLPDYTISVEQTYQKVSRFLLMSKSSMAILTRAHGTPGSLTRKQRIHNYENLSSWTPDWSDFQVFNRGLRTSLSWVHYKDAKERPRLGFPPHFNASAGLLPKIYGTKDTSILRVGGKRVGTLKQVVSFTEEEASKAEFKAHLDSKIGSVWEAAISLFDGADIASWAASFIKATTAEQHSLTGRAWEQSFKDGLAYLLPLLQDAESQLALPLAQEEAKEAMALLQRLSVGGESDQYATLAGSYCFNRCFVVTSKGGMGIAPSDSRVGDVISVILGNGVPTILRSSASMWVLVGESYIEGCMCGEEFQGSHGKFVDEEIFSIM